MDVITELVERARIVLCVDPGAAGYLWRVELRWDDGNVDTTTGPGVVVGIQCTVHSSSSAWPVEIFATHKG